MRDAVEILYDNEEDAVRRKERAMLVMERGVEAPAMPRLRGYDEKAVSAAHRVETGEETLVQQQFRDEVDANTIVRRFGITREMPFGAAAGMYGDFTGLVDYESTVEALERARAAFMSLPLEVRERYGNDPGRLIRRAYEVPESDFLTEVGFQAPPAPVVAAPAVEASGASE